MNNTLRSILVIIALVVIGGLVWHFSGNTPVASDQTVATVNGVAITQTELSNEEAQIAAQSGSTSTSTAEFVTPALNTLIEQTLLKQAAIQAGIVASSTEIDAQLASAKSQFKTTADYQTALSKNGLTETSLRQKISVNLLINTFLNGQLKLSEATTTPAEIQQSYTQEAAQMKDAPPLAQVKDQIAGALVQQKQQAMVSAYVAKLRAAADVKILIATSTPASTTSTAPAPAATSSTP